MKTLLLMTCAISVSWAGDLSETYEKAYFLEKAKGKSQEAAVIYREIAATKPTEKNRAIVVKSLKRLLKIYEVKKSDPQKLQDYLAKLNLDFEKGQMGPGISKPKFWGGGGNGYELSAELRPDKPDRWCGKITRYDKNGIFGTFTSSLDSKIFQGKTVELSGWMKLEDVENMAGLWLRSDAGKTVASFYNMNDRQIKGSHDWKRYSFEIEIPDNVTNINFGALMSGGGTLWVDDLEIKIVAKK